MQKLRRNFERDKATRRALRRLGWSVLVVWECHTVGAKRASLEARLRKFLVAEGEIPIAPFVAKDFRG